MRIALYILFHRAAAPSQSLPSTRTDDFNMLSVRHCCGFTASRLKVAWCCLSYVPVLLINYSTGWYCLNYRKNYSESRALGYLTSGIWSGPTSVLRKEWKWFSLTAHIRLKSNLWCLCAHSLTAFQGKCTDFKGVWKHFFPLNRTDL